MTRFAINARRVSLSLSALQRLIPLDLTESSLYLADIYFLGKLAILRLPSFLAVPRAPFTILQRFPLSSSCRENKCVIPLFALFLRRFSSFSGPRPAARSLQPLPRKRLLVYQLTIRLSGSDTRLTPRRPAENSLKL